MGDDATRHRSALCGTEPCRVMTHHNKRLIFEEFFIPNLVGHLVVGNFTNVVQGTGLILQCQVHWISRQGKRTCFNTCWILHTTKASFLSYANTVTLIGQVVVLRRSKVESGQLAFEPGQPLKTTLGRSTGGGTGNLTHFDFPRPQRRLPWKSKYSHADV